MANNNPIESWTNTSSNVAEQPVFDYAEIMGFPKFEKSQPVAQQDRPTIINRTNVGELFPGEEGTNLRALMRDYSIDSITVGPSRDGSRSFSISFSQDVSAPGLTVPRTLNGNLALTERGFTISGLQGLTVGEGIFSADIVSLTYDGTDLTASTRLVSGLPVPAEAAGMAQPINRALQRFR